jgi:hypothetical protein
MAAKHTAKRTRGVTKPRPTVSADASGTEQKSASWVAGMRSHFQQTGYYRVEDLERLLGDPRQSFEVSTAHDLQFCASPAHK